MAHGSLTELSVRQTQPAPPLPPEPGPTAPAQAPAVTSNNQWWAAALILVVAVGLLLGGWRLDTAWKRTQAEEAEDSARGTDALMWVRWVGERNGRMAMFTGCRASAYKYWESQGTGLLEDFDSTVGGVLAEARVDHVDEQGGSYFVTFDGRLGGGAGVNFTVRLVSENGRWKACGLGGPDQYS